MQWLFPFPFSSLSGITSSHCETLSPDFPEKEQKFSAQETEMTQYSKRSLSTTSSDPWTWSFKGSCEETQRTEHGFLFHHCHKKSKGEFLNIFLALKEWTKRIWHFQIFCCCFLMAGTKNYLEKWARVDPNGNVASLSIKAVRGFFCLFVVVCSVLTSGSWTRWSLQVFSNWSHLFWSLKIFQSPLNSVFSLSLWTQLTKVSVFACLIDVLTEFQTFLFPAFSHCALPGCGFGNSQ